MQYTFATTMTPVQFGGVEPEADNIEEARDSEHELYGAPYNTYEHPMPPGVMLAKSFSQTRSSFNTNMLPTRNLTYPPLLPPSFPPPSPTGSTATSRTSHSHSRSFSFTVGGSRFLPPLDYDEHEHDDEPPEASLVECDPDVDTPSIESQVGPAPRTSSKRTAAHERERAAGYIPRPPNAFILFRASFVRAKRLEMSGVSQAGSALNPDTSKTTVVSAGKTFPSFVRFHYFIFLHYPITYVLTDILYSIFYKVPTQHPHTRRSQSSPASSGEVWTRASEQYGRHGPRRRKQNIGGSIRIGGSDPPMRVVYEYEMEEGEAGRIKEEAPLREEREGRKPRN